VKNLLSRDEMLLGELHKAYPDYALPSVTFNDKYTLGINSETVDIIALSGGHSVGDAIIYFKNSNVLHIGDIIFADMFPFVDIEHGGNVVKLSENIQKIIDMVPSNTKIVPGHGRVLSTEDLKEYKQMVVSTTEIIRKEMEKKKSLEEIKSSKPLQAYSEWQVAFSCDDWIEVIYNSLK
jgi:glyoxylase-like metal-dependent hydrolase (beta-lactamase superfamily II)